MDLQLKGKVAIVTGGGGGIGSGISRVLGAEGANVAIVDIDREGANRVVEELKAKGVDALAVIADCLNVEDIHRAVEQIIKYFGRVDILVNNVGGSTVKGGVPIKDIEKVDEETYDLIVDLNLKSTFFFTKAVIPYMRARQYGRIVNIASIAGRVGIEFPDGGGPVIQYSAAKAGVIGLTRRLAKDVGPDGIYVNAVAPGSIKSGPRVEALWEKRDEQALVKIMALRRRGEVDEVARVVVFLCSDAASYVTGVTIDVDGGWLTI